MKVLLTPDKFKGSLTAFEVCDAMHKGITRCDPSIEVVHYPLADGGEGSLDVIDANLGLKTIQLEVSGPRFELIKAHYKVGNDAAYIEMALASGLQLLKKSERDCLYTSTYGTGQLVKDAVLRGYRKIYLFIGGSATNDAGIGMAAALGYRFLDKNKLPIKTIGKHLIKLDSIDDSQLSIDKENIEFFVVTDVKNVIYGKNGAAYTYASQKGADKPGIQLLDKGLRNFSLVVDKTYGIRVDNLEGGGAAGGLGAGLAALFKAKILPGIETIMEITHFQRSLTATDLIITGEGKLDLQSIQGKVIDGVCRMAKSNNIPVAIICGMVENLKEIQDKLNIKSIHPLVSEKITTARAIRDARQLVTKRSEQLIRDFVNNL